MSKLNSGTWGGMIAMGLRVDLYCDPCGRHVELDLSTLPPEGSSIGKTFVCACGRRVRPIVSPRSVEKAVPVNRTLPKP